MFKRCLALILCLMLLPMVSLAEADTSKPVVLTFYYLGDEGGPTAAAALDALNQKLKEKINATLDPIAISYGDMAQKLPVILGSGEEYDLIYTSNWAYYFSEGAKGAFMPLDDLMAKYAPTMLEDLTSSGRARSLRINGKICMVPVTSPGFELHDFIYRDDLRIKYGMAPIASLDDLEVFMDKVLENENGMLPLNLSVDNFQLWYNLFYCNNWGGQNGGGIGLTHFILTFDQTTPGEVINVIETPQFEEFAERMHRWYQKGYWSKSILSEKTSVRNQFYVGASAVNLENQWNMNAIYANFKKEHPDWSIGYYSMNENGNRRMTSPSGDGTAIGAYSKNPERAMMFLNLCYTDREVYDLLNYGVLGVNYDLTEDGKLKPSQSALNGADVSIDNYAMGIQFAQFARSNAEDWDFVTQKQAEWLKKGIVPLMDGFALDQQNVSAEIAAVNNVTTEYLLPIIFGTVDPATAIPVLKQKLAEAGLQKIIDEVNAQAKVYQANLTK